MTISSRRFAKATPEAIHDLVIVGAGPAGLSAFIQARRQGLCPIVVDPSGPGGAVRGGRRVENYPGFRTCSGLELADRMTAHAEAFGLEVLPDRVSELRSDGGWCLLLTSGRTLTARAAVLATGQIPVVPEALAPWATAGTLLLPGAFKAEDWRGRKVIVVGGGDVAFDQALHLLDHGANPEIICRSAPRALPCLQEEVRERGIPVHEGWAPAESVQRPPHSVAFVNLRNPADRIAFNADGVLAATGRRPAAPAVFGPAGAFLNAASFRPGDGLPPGLFIAGDLWRGNLRQAAVAAGDGCAAAIAVFTYLAEGATGGRA